MGIKLVPYYEVAVENIRQYMQNTAIESVFVHRAGEMDQCLWPLDALAEDPAPT